MPSAPILKQADPDEDFVLRTNASALVAVLLQESHPVEYASRLLTKHEINYHTTERGALAIVWAMGNFRGYLEATSTTIITDHPLRDLPGGPYRSKLTT